MARSRPPRTTLAQYVAARVAHKRRQAGWTQDDLARAVGVNRSTITRFESGETVDPPLSLIDRIATALGVPVSDLVPSAPPDRTAPPNETYQLHARPRAIRDSSWRSRERPLARAG